MKKILFLMICCCGIFGAGEVTAATCIAGTEITGKNGKVYCVSNTGMNWWSAFTWCEKQGRHLVTINDACDTAEDIWNGVYSKGACKNLVGSKITGWCWTAVPLNENPAYRIHPQEGRIGDDDAGNLGYSSYRTSTNRALCL